MRRTWLVLIVVTGVLDLRCEPAPDSGQDPRDLQAYIAELRESGMTESARGDLSTIASIRTGGTILGFPKDDLTGGYGRSYLSTTCPVPGADPDTTRRWRAEVEERIDRDLEILRGYADRDASGFVSTLEAQQFLDLVEFGLLAAHIVAADGPSAAAVARGSGLTTDRVLARVGEYNALATQLNEASEVSTPLIELTAPGSGVAVEPGPVREKE